MVVWSESLDRIIPLCQDFEERLIKMLWRSRPVVSATTTATATTSASNPTSVAGSAAGSHCHGAPGGNGNGNGNRASTWATVSEAELVDHSGGSVGGHGHGEATRLPPPRGGAGGVVRGLFGEQGRDDYEADFGRDPSGDVSMEKVGSGGRSGSDGTFAEQGKRYKRTWYGKKVALQRSENLDKQDTLDDVEELRGEQKRPVRLYAPLYNGLAAGMALCMSFSSLSFASS